MEGKSSKSTISDEDLTFLMRNTNKSAEEIQVKLLNKRKKGFEKQTKDGGESI